MLPADNTYCLPIIKGTRAEVEETLAAAVQRYRYAEIWLDYIEDLKPGFAASLVRRYPDRLIMVFRRLKLARPHLTSQERRAILTSLAGKKVLVDLDLTTQSRDVAWLERNKIQVKKLLSYHNFIRTPSDANLSLIVKRMRRHKAHLIKIATHCVHKRDALRLLSLLLKLRERGDRAIVLGMGKDGMITRVFGALWGNSVAFAPLKASARSAPGQIPITKLDSIIRALR